jgi:hypothetical protein
LATSGSSVMGKLPSAFVSYSLPRRGLLVLIPVAFICILVSASCSSVQAGSFPNIVSSATSGFRTSCSVQSPDDHSTSTLASSKNFTDLIFGDRNVYYGTSPFLFSVCGADDRTVESADTETSHSGRRILNDFHVY